MNHSNAVCIVIILNHEFAWLSSVRAELSERAEFDWGGREQGQGLKTTGCSCLFDQSDFFVGGEADQQWCCAAWTVSEHETSLHAGPPKA